ncbi:TIGR03766 family XrtG-associated glycosyltransferase [Lacticaseibacillus sp. GG6-2]
MGKRLFDWGQRGINGIFMVLFGATTLFAIIHPNLIVGDNWKTGAGTTIVTAIGLIIALAVAIALYAYPRFRRGCYWLFVDHGRVSACVLLAAVVVWQLVFVTTLHPPIGWDAGALHQTLTDTTSNNLRSYYSQNFNNLPILLVMHTLAQWLHSTSWLTFDYLTLVMVDLSAVANLVAIWLLAPRQLTTGLYVHALWLSLFATIIVPYTDAWVLPLVSLMFVGYALMRRESWWFSLFGAALLAASTVAAYFIKPSAIVPFLAIVVISILYALRGRRGSWRVAICLLVMAGVGGGSYVVANRAIKQQTYIQVNPGRAIPAVHFVSMGMSGQGGYNARDALMMAVLPTKKARSAYSVRKIKQRLGNMGVLGYLQFLVHKHYNNTADGSFAWDKEGSFINSNPKPKPGPGLKNHLQQYVYLYGTNLGDFRWWSQALWVIALGLIFLAYSDQHRVMQLLRVTIIGAFLYLLAFEGGRSRYLIQYLPAFLIMATLAAPTSLRRLQRLFAWGRKPIADEDPID